MKSYKKLSVFLIILLLILGLAKLQTNKENKTFYIEELSSLIKIASSAVDRVPDIEGDFEEVRLDIYDG
ncbi:hypothetical protein EZV73_21185 [Acidaminobacter sp. JC074]|uniref:hypothetical protein n=1 Tax=Acidaminobacter sp. JC074 TaxID=2530199 RepID=UPI001F0E3FF6|nr:hypothetical protein [Acidaminobacter sp. JC074]MCH4890108.1 hypothetical protein [Acidaminobacter sp. JC074]